MKEIKIIEEIEEDIILLNFLMGEHLKMDELELEALKNLEKNIKKLNLQEENKNGRKKKR